MLHFHFIHTEKCLYFFMCKRSTTTRVFHSAKLSPSEEKSKQCRNFCSSLPECLVLLSTLISYDDLLIYYDPCAVIFVTLSSYGDYDLVMTSTTSLQGWANTTHFFSSCIYYYTCRNPTSRNDPVRSTCPCICHCSILDRHARATSTLFSLAGSPCADAVNDDVCHGDALGSDSDYDWIRHCCKSESSLCCEGSVTDCGENDYDDGHCNIEKT